MASLLSRIKDRKLGQWGLAYLAGAWVVFEATGTVLEAWTLPLFLVRATHVLLVAGFFAVLVAAWYHGDEGRQRVSGPELLILTVLLFLTGGVLFALDRGEGSDLARPLPPPSRSKPLVAALPFANLSPHEEDAYLAAGFHEELIAQLYRIGGLGVVSRTSVMGYREPDQNIRDIADALGATAIVEGSVRKAGQQVRLTVQLIDPVSDDHLWADQYDLEFSLDRLLEAQANIAARIAVALRAELTAADQARLETRHTDDLGAYQAYLRGLYFLHRPHYTQDDVDRALREFEDAVALDPGFALAWAELAESHAREVYFWSDASEQRIRMAREAAQRARQAGDIAPETRLALAAAQLYLDRNAERALQEIDQVEGELPGHPDVFRVRSAALEVQGRFRESARVQHQLLRVSPGDASVHSHLAYMHWLLREYQEAQSQADLALGLAPDHLWPALYKVLIPLSRHGPTAETRMFADRIGQTNDWTVWTRYWERMLADDFEGANQIVQAWPDPWIRTKMWARPTVLYEAWIRWARGEGEAAAGLFRQAVELLEQEVTEWPDDPRFRSSLGTAYAALGRRDDALREGRRAMELLPVAVDGFYGQPFEWDMAFTYTLLGDEDPAIALLEDLSRRPSWISPAWLEHEFRFDALRRTPRFLALTSE